MIHRAPGIQGLSPLHNSQNDFSPFFSTSDSICFFGGEVRGVGFKSIQVFFLRAFHAYSIVQRSHILNMVVYFCPTKCWCFHIAWVSNPFIPINIVFSPQQKPHSLKPEILVTKYFCSLHNHSTVPGRYWILHKSMLSEAKKKKAIKQTPLQNIDLQITK